MNADAPSVSANSSNTLTFPVTNAAVGSTVCVSPANAYGSIAISYARVVTAGMVEIGLINPTGAAFDPPPMNYFVTVIE